MATPTITHGTARAYTVPTDAPEADGTMYWKKTTLVVVELFTDGSPSDPSPTVPRGLGYTYAMPATAKVAAELIQKIVVGKSPMDIPRTYAALKYQLRNEGTRGIGAAALSAIDVALWDLKAKLLGQPLCLLLGRSRDAVPVYGSGGFTAYDDHQLQNQLGGWAEQGITMVKMKIGTHPEQDPARVALARRTVGADVQVFVDANGAYSAKQALRLAERFAELDVRWFEEPVSSDDLSNLRLLRQRAPAGMEIAAGEYGWEPMYFRRMLEAAAVDVLQADASRCGGATGFLAAAELADAHPLPFSAHCAPSLHLHLAAAARPLRHIEYFHDHVRIESMLFDGFRPANGGVMTPDLSRPGIGLEFKEKDAQKFAEKV